jgi:hypothetical protein
VRDAPFFIAPAMTRQQAGFDDSGSRLPHSKAMAGFLD